MVPLYLFLFLGLEAYSASEVTLVISGSSLNSIDIITEELEVIPGIFPGIPIASSLAGTAQLIDDQVLVCGGSGMRDLCQHLNLTSQRWDSTSRMLWQQSYSSSVLHDGTMFIFGGFDGDDPLQRVERYYSDSNSWAYVWEWVMPAATVRFCAVKYGDFIYMMGGNTDFGTEGNEMVRLSTATNEYENMPPMFQARYDHACAVVTINGEDGILVTGGRDFDVGYLSSTEFFSFADNKWNIKADMTSTRQYHGMSVLKGRAVAFGGQNNQPHDTIEVYNDVDDKWELAEGSKLTEQRSGPAHVNVPWMPIYKK